MTAARVVRNNSERPLSVTRAVARIGQAGARAAHRHGAGVGTYCV